MEENTLARRVIAITWQKGLEMSLQIVITLDRGEAIEVAHTLTMDAFDLAKEAAFWEGFGDPKQNKRCLTKAQLISRIANTFALATIMEEGETASNEQV